MNGTLLLNILLTIAAQQAAQGRNVVDGVDRNHGLEALTELHFRFGKKYDAEKFPYREPRKALDRWLEMLIGKGMSFADISYARHPKESERHSRMTAGFVGGGGTWFIVTSMREERLVWLCNLKPDFGPQNNMLGWRYGFSGEPADFIADAPQLAISRENFIEALDRIIKFARSNGLEMWSDNFFQPALDTLQRRISLTENGISFAGLNIHPERAEVLSAVTRAWAFGGMGSWNDQWVGSDKRQAEYERVSDTLFAILIEATIAATNDPRSA
ncbi:hypothetical protein L5876_06705 [Hyphobacterium sp. SN044]|uniref:hypothetical protein n=1 Tax=Hyphobacterium sp. SN044 TaxID=2912575 RepID=UPI001F2BC563|nr:hypothetical protein [Hyphobacterium sp. SN044]MCF8879496.1 hypothetical protein [Hyphobacterium sp. SN044]